MIKPYYDYHKVPLSIRVAHWAWVFFMAAAIVAMVAGYHRPDARRSNIPNEVGTTTVSR
jgi:hypothetical protein